MGLYTKSILKRENYEKELECEAEESLFNAKEKSVPKSKMESLYDAVKYILNIFKIKFQPLKNCKDSSELFESTFEPLGIMYDAVSLSEQEWKKRHEYMIGFLEDGRAVVLTPTLLGYCYISPDTEKKKLVTKHTKLQDKAYVFYRPLKIGKNPTISFLTYMFKLISARDYIPIIIATGIVSALGLITPALNYWVLDTLIYEDNPYTELIYGAVMFITVGFVSCIVKTVKTMILGTTQLRITAQMQSAVMARTLILPQSFFLNSSSGKLSKRIRISRTLADKMVSIVLDIIFNVLFSLMYISQMAGYAPALYIPAILVLLSQIGVSIITSIAFAKNKVKVTDAQMEAGQFLFSSLKGIQKIRGFGVGRLVYSQWAKLYSKVLMYTLDPPLLVKFGGVLSTLISSFGTVLLLGMIVPNNIERANYIAFNSSYSFIISAMSEVLIIIRSIFIVRPLIQYMKPILETKPEEDSSSEYVRNLEGKIEINNITFSYDNGAQNVLKDFSLKIEKGEKIAIVGESGCGKSTLLKILMGFESAQSGTVKYDGKSIQKLNKRSLRKRIGSVFQFSRVMPGTLFSNISFNTSQFTEKDVWEAAEKAHIAEYVRSLEMGMETKITQSNVGGFSGGQKQRILLARAFVGNPSILFLDEATSALDNVTQQKVLDSIFDMKVTVVMVAHRLSTVKECDRIIVMRDGNIVEEGNYDKLMSINGYFAELVRKQIAEKI